MVSRFSPDPRASNTALSFVTVGGPLEQRSEPRTAFLAVGGEGGLDARRNLRVPLSGEGAGLDEVVEAARATGAGDLTATASTAAASFGVAAERAVVSGEPMLEDAHAAICPAVKAFPTRTAYEEWVRRTSASTVRMSFSSATTVASSLVED